MDCPCGFKMNLININKNKYFYCNNCGYLKKEVVLSSEKQKERYDYHVCDDKYLAYMNDVFNQIKEFIIGNKVLDFGCGKIHALSDIMNNNGFDSYFYDLFYYPSFPSDLYDSIVMIEVFEHLDNPLDELLKLKYFLAKGGRFIIQTKMYPKKLDNWWYLRDTTHVSFVNEVTIDEWAKILNMKLISLNGDIFVLERID